MTQYIQKAGYEITELDREYLILDPDQFTVTKLNEVGGFCWNLLKEVQSVESLLEAVKRHFSLSVGDDVLVEDIEAFIAELGKCRLIRNVG